MDKQELGCSNISENRTRPGRAGGRKLVDFREREAGRGSRQEKDPERERSPSGMRFTMTFLKSQTAKQGQKFCVPAAKPGASSSQNFLREGGNPPSFGIVTMSWKQIEVAAAHAVTEATERLQVTKSFASIFSFAQE